MCFLNVNKNENNGGESVSQEIATVSCFCSACDRHARRSREEEIKTWKVSVYLHGVF